MHASVDVHEVGADLGARRLDTLDDGLGEGSNVTIGRVESDGDDGLAGSDRPVCQGVSGATEGVQVLLRPPQSRSQA
jgi:hypothetical protein